MSDSETTFEIAVQRLLSTIGVESKTEALKVDYNENQIHVLLRVSEEEEGCEWWQNHVKALRIGEVDAVWDLHICMELKIDEAAELAYIWNFIASSPDDIQSMVEEIITLWEEVDTLPILKHVRIDSVRLGVSGRNVPSGFTVTGKPSMKGAVLTSGGAT